MNKRTGYTTIRLHQGTWGTHPPFLLFQGRLLNITVRPCLTRFATSRVDIYPTVKMHFVNTVEYTHILPHGFVLLPTIVEAGC